jgi:hypothetical protein
MKLFKEESDSLLILMDNEIEEFYINFRNSMFNFYKEHSFTRPLKQWSDKLNAYQKQQDYELIEETIIKIISLYACDLMRVGSDYNVNILNSNIKRWNRISKNNISSSNLIFVLHEIYCVFEKNRDINDYHFLFHQLELYLIYKDFTQLIEYSIEKGTISVLDKLMDYDPKILSVIIKMYDLKDIKPNVKISSKKLFREIKSVSKLL